ncbi:TD and POZ domain-containing protein 1 [Araneus ventricosus]|uniref:TD and POZ domain-containing protein 1 n=1 Tax=Araneus ventricosus TaxID=182803 RepID=A0A4Y2IJ16_ARAVE|nr:TD and POZ domain-containing protein 1 [Araneus ventricosus]
MASADGLKRKCFTFIWKLENARYFGEKEVCIESPVFFVDGIEKTKWKLHLFPIRTKYIGLILVEGVNKIDINFELAFIALDGTVLTSTNAMTGTFYENQNLGPYYLEATEDLFDSKRSSCVTTRCRMWKSIGELSEDVQCMARTCIGVEKRSFVWNVGNFSALTPEVKNIYEIRSVKTAEQVMSLELLLTKRLHSEEVIRFGVTPNNRIVRIYTIEFFIVDTFENTVGVMKDGLLFHKEFNDESFAVFLTKQEVMEKNNACLHNGALTFRGECTFSFGTHLEEIEGVSSNCPAIESRERDCPWYPSEGSPVLYPVEDVVSDPKRVLIDNLKSMLTNSSLYDVKLRTSKKTHPAHKCILSARSPVFEAMFANVMREKITDCVEIEDLNDDTVSRLLLYIYSGEMEELEWVSATELYEAADKYQILTLKDVCSSYVKTNLCRSNACDALVLADLHQDVDLKTFVQDFILRLGKDIMNSEEWEHLMRDNIKLAAETMHLLYKK